MVNKIINCSSYFVYGNNLFILYLGTSNYDISDDEGGSPDFFFLQSWIQLLISLMDQMVINKNLTVIKERSIFLFFQARL
jgi:hypothetical protein